MEDQPERLVAAGTVSPVRVGASFALALLAAIALGVVCSVAELGTGLSLVILALAIVMAAPGLIALAQLSPRRRQR